MDAYKEKNKIKKTKVEKTVLWICFAIFFVYALTLVYPFFWMTINAGKTKMEFFRSTMNFANDYDWSVFWRALTKVTITAGAGESAYQVSMLRMFGNSIFLTVVLTALEVFVSACTAYVVCYFKFPCRKFIYGIVIFTMVVPLVGTLPVCYDFFYKSGLLNNLFGMILLCVNGLSFTFLILYGSDQNLSWTYAEAASIDGAGPFRTFFLVMLPLMKPALVAMAVVTAIGFWNDYSTPAIYYPDRPTLAYGINTMINDVRKSSAGEYGSDYPMMFACILMAIIPIVIFFACFQKTIMKNMVAGGLKG